MKLILILVSTIGCSSYIDKMHREFDQGQTQETFLDKKYDKFALYRGAKRTGSNSINSADNPKVQPQVKRDYKPLEQARHRYNANDLLDNDNSASLWSGEGKDSYLFTTDQRKRRGDIIIINVMGKLKDEITAELKRAFPEKFILPTQDKKDEKNPNEKDAKNKNTASQKPVTETDDPASNPSTVYDKISGVIVEEINDDHLLISGRKSLLFRNKKHLVELQALVNRKNIGFDENVNSDDILENNVNVLR